MHDLYSYNQEKSMARKYMNRFAIDEDDQFEIHVKDYKCDNKYMYNAAAAEEVMRKAQQG